MFQRHVERAINCGLLVHEHKGKAGGREQTLSEHQFKKQSQCQIFILDHTATGKACVLLKAPQTDFSTASYTHNNTVVRVED